jgi:hypothetical protein
VSKIYPVAIVGEQNYQPAVGACRVGEKAYVLREPDNPYDAMALVVLNERGDTIGYIGRDHWLQDVVNEQGRLAVASIKDIEQTANGYLGVVLNVIVTDNETAEVSYHRASGQSAPAARSSSSAPASLGAMSGRLAPDDDDGGGKPAGDVPLSTVIIVGVVLLGLAIFLFG